LERPKQGFQMPLTDWFLGDFASFAREAWHDSGAADAGYLDPKAVDALFDDHRSGRADHAKLLYAITMFGYWWRYQRVGAAPQTLRAI
jgi:asparagine synthase (glutamine-hydrolysing)